MARKPIPHDDDLSFLDATPTMQNIPSSKSEPASPPAVPAPVRMQSAQVAEQASRMEPEQATARDDAGKSLAVKVSAAPVKFDGRSFAFSDFEGAQRLAGIYLASGVLPRSTLMGCRSDREAIARIVVILEKGMAIGLRASEAVQAVTIINGKLCLWGDPMVAVVLAHPDCEGITDEQVGTGDERKWVVTAHRRGRKVSPASFSVKDAKVAGLWGKSGPWSQYPDRMLLIRARTLAIRNAWADVLMGMTGAEDVIDYPQQQNPDQTRQATAELMQRLAGQ